MTSTIIIMENLRLLLYISDGLSVDWLSNKLYISGNDRLGVVDLSNGYHKELNSTTSAHYYFGGNIVVDPTNRYNTMCMIMVYCIVDQMPLLIVASLEQVLNETDTALE